VRNSTETLIVAMRILSQDIQSEDGVVSAATAEAAQRLAEQQERIKRLEEAGDAMEKRLHLRKNISDQFVYKGDAESVENWNKAKEDKL